MLPWNIMASIRSFWSRLPARFLAGGPTLAGEMFFFNRVASRRLSVVWTWMVAPGAMVSRM